MPVIINGSTGISGTDGSAGTPAVQGTDTNTGMFFPAAGQIAFAEGGVEAMRLDASGRLGVGTSTPDNIIDVRGASSPQITLNNTSASANDTTDVTLATFGGSTPFWSRLNYSASQHIFRTYGAERARITSGGDFQFNSGYGSVATAFGCRAWVNFNGTGTVAIRASGNVSSVSDLGTGTYQVNFATAMPDANYSVVGFTRANVGVDGGIIFSDANLAAGNTSAINVQQRFTGASYDPTLLCVAIFR